MLKNAFKSKSSVTNSRLIRTGSLIDYTTVKNNIWTSKLDEDGGLVVGASLLKLNDILDILSIAKENKQDLGKQALIAIIETIKRGLFTPPKGFESSVIEKGLLQIAKKRKNCSLANDALINLYNANGEVQKLIDLHTKISNR